MGDDARAPEPFDDAVGEIARALGGAAREDQHVALGERVTHGGFERLFVIDDGAEKQRRAAMFRHGRRHHGAVCVEYLRGRELGARLRQFIARRKHRHPWLGEHIQRANPAGRQQADFARADDRARAHERFAARHVRARMGDELSGPGRAANLDSVGPQGLGLLDHNDRVGAARQRATGGDGRRRAPRHTHMGRDATGDLFAIERQAHRRCFAGAGDIRCPETKAIDVGAVKGRHIDGRENVARQGAA